MATKTRQARAAAVEAAGPPLWAYALAFAGALYAVLEAYGPALHGPFVFDDLYLPYGSARAAALPLQNWAGVRPVLGLSFWIDFQLWGQKTFGYHVINVLFHFVSSVLLFFILRKLLTWGACPEPRRTTLASFGAALFLLHPIQTEAVAYVASRSENLSVLFFFAAFTVFLYRSDSAIGWSRAAAVLVLFACAIGSKEHTVTLPALLLLTDYFWNPGFSFEGIRRNARLYVPMAILAVAGIAFFSRYVARDPMIGFHITGLGPGTYFLTECRAVFTYLRLFVLPVSQGIDYDYPVSRTLLEHGAFAALAGLLLLTGAAFYFRKRVPFAAYGWFLFLILLSPTSSFIPINDTFAERRLYLPFFGLVLVLFEPLRRIRMRPLALSGILAILCCGAGYGTWRRAQVWGNATELFRDAVAHAPEKARTHIGLGNALLHEGKCQDALVQYGIASRLEEPDYSLWFNLAAAYECTNAPENAVMMLQRSIARRPHASAFALLGRVQSKQHLFPESLNSFTKAIASDPSYALTYAYRGAVYAATGQPRLAYQDYMHCLQLDPANTFAQQGLQLLTEQR